MHHLILGGARSGKSSYAERLVRELALNNNKELVYLATATAKDDEMAARIQRHQRDRSKESWRLIEEPLDLASVLRESTQAQCILIDCLTLWLSNCLHELPEHGDQWVERKRAFLTALGDCPSDVVMVTNDVGSGIVPVGELSRRFVDEAGWLHQRLAEHCEHVTLVIAGLANKLK